MSFALGFLTGMVVITFPCFVSALLIVMLLLFLCSTKEKYEGCLGCMPPLPPNDLIPTKIYNRNSPCLGPCNVNEDCQSPCQSCSKALGGRCVPSLRS